MAKINKLTKKQKVLLIVVSILIDILSIAVLMNLNDNAIDITANDYNIALVCYNCGSNNCTY